MTRELDIELVDAQTKHAGSMDVSREDGKMMIGPEQSSDMGDYGDELLGVSSRQRGRKKEMTPAPRSRSRKQSARKGSSSAASVVGMSHRRQRKWAW